MAKRGRGRVQQNLRSVPYQPTLALGALAAKDVISATPLAAGDTTYLLLNVTGTYAWDAPGAGSGPITFGIASGDYTDAQIEEAIEATGSIALAGKVAQEQANRLVRTIGTISEQRPVFNDGRPTKTRLNWKVAIGSQPVFWVYNQTGIALVTGSAVLPVGKALIKFL